MKKLFSLLLAFLFIQGTLLAQNKTVTGTVTDDKGSGVANASVIVPGSTIGTSTDENGKFSISVPTATKTLRVSAVNFEMQTITIRGNTANASLVVSNNELEAVVITGIKTIKRTEYAGAVSRIDEKQIADKPVGSFDQILQGVAPGLLALTGSGQPGTSANIIIRGRNSIEGGSDPLYVVDGIPVEAGAFQGLNPNDFATIDILKDASSTALYGSRGSAGVIVVTTKKGVGNKLKLSYGVQMGIKSKPDFAFTPMTTSELLKAQNDYGVVLGTPLDNSMPGWFYASNNPRYAGLSAAGKVDADRRLDSISKINTNWTDYMFRSGPFSNHQLSISGGTGKTRIYSSIALYNEDGVTPRTDMRRISFRNNVDYADDKLSVSLTSSVAYTKRNFQQSTVSANLGNPFLTVNVAAPYARVFKDDGTYFTGNSGSFAGAVNSSFAGANLLDLTYLDRNYNDQIKTVFGLNANYKITDEITAGVVAGVDYRETQSSTYGSKLAFSRLTSPDSATKAGSQSEGLARFFSVNVRPTVGYRKEFAQKHTVDISVYGEMFKEYSKVFSFIGYGKDPRTPNTPAGITQGNAANLLYANVGGSKSENALFSGLAIASYSYDNRYSVNASYRKDGSSKLPTATRWQDFYAVGAIWTVSNEAFLENSSVVNNLRLRGSYGSAGNSNNFPFGDFGYLDQYGTGGYSGLGTIVVSNIGNPLLKWETTYTANIGTDFSLFKNRLYGSADVYNKTTKDLFVEKQLTAEGGSYTTFINAGELTNKGVEVDISYDIIKNSKVTWSVRGNFGYNKNNVKSLAGEQSYESGTSLITEGLPLGSHYEVGWAGVDQATGAPLYYTKDGLVTNVNSADNKVQTWGTWEAPWKGGFGTTVRSGGFDLSVLCSWQKGSTKGDNLEYFVENPVGFLRGGYNQSSSLNFWKKPGDIASTPSPVYGTSFSSKIIHDASFLRLRDVTLSYTIPRDMIKSTKFMSNARFFVQGTNLFIWTKWRGMDPEAGPVNINLNEFPNPRAVTAGLDITF